MRKALAWVLGIGLIVNGITMLAEPSAWYAAMPGVTETGPFNPHFVRDIGIGYLVSGAGLLWFVLSPRAWPAALASAAFLGLHALLHLRDVAAGAEHAHQLLSDLPTVFLPPILAIWIAWPPRASYQGENR